MATIYILYSKKLDRFYIGSSTLFVSERLKNHNDLYYENKYTSAGIPWEIYWYAELPDMALALKIEGYIKKMKSRKYYADLKNYPEITEKLILKYS